MIKITRTELEGFFCMEAEGEWNYFVDSKGNVYWNGMSKRLWTLQS